MSTNDIHARLNAEAEHRAAAVRFTEDVRVWTEALIVVAAVAFLFSVMR